MTSRHYINRQGNSQYSIEFRNYSHHCLTNGIVTVYPMNGQPHSLAIKYNVHTRRLVTFIGGRRLSLKPFVPSNNRRLFPPPSVGVHTLAVKSAFPEQISMIPRGYHCHRLAAKSTRNAQQLLGVNRTLKIQSVQYELPLSPLRSRKGKRQHYTETPFSRINQVGSKY